MLPHAPVELVCAAGGAKPDGLMLLARGREGSLCCLGWPGLQQRGRLLQGIRAVAATASGCGLFTQGKPHACHFSNRKILAQG
jgi:hypothetical protein